MLTTINKKNFSNNKTIDILNKKYYRLHKSDKSKIQKVLIKINDNAYITPHYHKKDEMIVILEGLCGVITFGSKGNKNDFFIISSDKYNKKNKYHFGYQIKAKLCHTLISLSKVPCSSASDLVVSSSSSRRSVVVSSAIRSASVLLCSDWICLIRCSF